MNKTSFNEFEYQGWEKVAGNYHENFGKFTPKIATTLIDEAAITPNDKVLDIACGPGYVGARALEKTAFVTGVDFSRNMIEKAKCLHPKILFEVMNAEDLQFPNATFDRVLINFGILHFANPVKAIQEACRVLKPSGKFLFTIWDKPTPFDLVIEAAKEEGDPTVSLPEGPDFSQFTNIKASKKNLIEAGFQSIIAERIIFLWQLETSEEFFQAFYTSGVRIGGILRAQKQEVIGKIMENLSLKMQCFQKNENLEVPVPVLLYKGTKSSESLR